MNRDLTKGSIWKHLIYLAVPASMGMLFNTLFNVVDTFYAGKIGTQALAGMGLAFPLFFILLSLTSGLGIGGNALLSGALGRKEYEKYHQYIKNISVLTLVLTVLVFFLGQGMNRFVFSFFDADPETIAYGQDYFSVILYGFFFYAVNGQLNALLSANGDTRSYRNFLILGFFLNLGLDPLFILGPFGLPKLGTKGVALATVIVQGIGSIYMLYRVQKLLNLPLKEILYKKTKVGIIIDILRQGVPASLNMMTIALGVFLINTFLLSYGQDNSVAAYGIGTRLVQLALLPALGLNQAVISITGQNYGAEQMDRVRETKTKALKLGLIVVGVGMALLYPLAPTLVSLFQDTKDVVRLGGIYLRIETVALGSYIVLNICISSLQGVQKPMFALIIGGYRQFLMPLILFPLLGGYFDFGVLGVWWSIAIINWSAALWTYLYNKKVMGGLADAS